MNYRIVWHLIGQAERPLDSGCLDEDFGTYHDAAVALNQWLSGYAEIGRSGDGSHWKARRSTDADLELRIWIDTAFPLDEAAPSAEAAVV